MKHLKIYETFNENIIKIGDFLKRKSIDDKHYEISVITHVTDFSRDIDIYEFAITSIDFKDTKFKKFDTRWSSSHLINRWYINEYSLLTDEELLSICNDINNTDDYYFEHLKKFNINLKEYALSKISNKYGL